MLDFFKPKPNEQKEEKQSKKRSSSEALYEIQVNGGSAVKHIKLEAGESLKPVASPSHARTCLSQVLSM